MHILIPHFLCSLDFTSRCFLRFLDETMRQNRLISKHEEIQHSADIVSCLRPKFKNTIFKKLR